MKLTIPYYLHKAGAGFPSPATDYIEEDIDLNMHLIRNVPATFIIRVQGKSMVDVIHNHTKCGFGCSRFDSLLIQLQTQNTTSCVYCLNSL